MNLHIDNEEDYKEALKMIEYLLELSEDKENDQLNPLIDLISSSIERYELNDEQIVQFIRKAEQ